MPAASPSVDRDHDEQDGQRHAQVRLEREHPAVRQRQPGQRLAAPDQDAGRGHLRGQPADRAEPPPVVGEPDEDDQAAGQQQPGLAPRPGGPERILHKRQPTGQEKPGDKAAVHGQAAQQGGRLGVRVPGAGFVNGAGGDRHPPHQRGEQIGHRRGDEQDQGVLAHAASAGPDTVGFHQAPLYGNGYPREGGSPVAGSIASAESSSGCGAAGLNSGSGSAPSA